MLQCINSIRRAECQGQLFPWFWCPSQVEKNTLFFPNLKGRKAQKLYLPDLHFRALCNAKRPQRSLLFLPLVGSGDTLDSPPQSKSCIYKWARQDPWKGLANVQTARGSDATGSWTQMTCLFCHVTSPAAAGADHLFSLQVFVPRQSPGLLPATAHCSWLWHQKQKGPLKVSRQESDITKPVGKGSF